MKLLNFTAENRIVIICGLLSSAMIYGIFCFRIDARQKTYLNDLQGKRSMRLITPHNTNSDSGVCKTSGGFAYDTGLKTWCWADVTIPEYSRRQGVAFSGGHLKVDSECNENQVWISENQLHFNVDPTTPITAEWCDKKFNMRAEIRTVPWHVRHKQGTEEWFGWRYTFGADYIIDQENPWSFFQVHPGIHDVPPHTALWVIKKNQFKGHRAGEIYVVNAANNEYKPTGIIPEAGESIDVVVHAIWGDSAKGLLQVYINGNVVYDRQVATIFKAYPWGGNAKWGIYKWHWANASDIEKSGQQGIHKLRTSMGPLRMITRTPNDLEYGKNAYSFVEPQ